ncbi:MAG: uracil-DNA glycosylase family protein [Myxococcota bacterium]
MTPQERTAALRRVAATLDRIDTPAYEADGRDPLEPILGGGDPSCRVAFFGRDPGRDEVRHQQPFIGKGGQLIRNVLHSIIEGEPCPNFRASERIGRVAFWANTVPYKPIGNKAWSVSTRRAVQPVIADLLVHGWRGSDVMCLGQNAFLWFGLNGSREDRARLKDAWTAEPRFEAAPAEIDLTAPDGASRRLRVWPVPHPSPLNATWHKRFPSLLAQRLDRVGFGPNTWRLDANDRGT